MMRSSQKTGVCGLCLLAVAGVALLATPAGATQNWVGTGNWITEAANWSGDLGSGAVPNLGQSGNVRSGTISILPGDAVSVLNLYIANGAGSADDITINMSGGTLNAADLCNWYGRSADTGSEMIWNMSGGTATFPAGMNMMYNAESTDTFTSASILNMTGGVMTFGGIITMEHDSAPATRTAHIELGGGILRAASFDISGGGSGVYSFNMSGGTLLLDGNVSSLPAGFTGDFIFNYDGGSNQTTITVVPEPSTCVLVVLGALCLGLVRRRNRS